MNWIKLFENFNREQPIDKRDIIDLLEGTGINYTQIYEFPIRNKEEREFYLGWIIKCSNPQDWVYNTPKNYGVNILNYRIEFIWTVKPNMDTLLSKLTPDWKEIKEWLLDLLQDMEKVENPNSFEYNKESKFLFKHDLKNKYFLVSYWSIWDFLYKKDIGYKNIKYFIWIILEHITNYKADTTIERKYYK